MRRDEIFRALTALGAELAERGLVADLYVVGGRHAPRRLILDGIHRTAPEGIRAFTGEGGFRRSWMSRPSRVGK
jgi:hypothetical protein